MKKLIYIIIALVCLSSCISNEQAVMEKKVSQCVEPRGFTHFQEYKTIRFCDEVDELLHSHKVDLHWDESFYSAFVEALDNPDTPEEFYEYNTQKAEMYKEEIAREKRIISYLESVKEKYPDIYTKTTFVIYKMEYLYLSSTGEKLFDACYGKFNTDGDLVAFRLSASGDWEIIGKDISIPKYEEIINQ